MANASALSWRVTTVDPRAAGPGRRGARS